MVLSDKEIKRALRERKIIIDPRPTDEQYTTSALDLTLGDEVVKFKTQSGDTHLDSYPFIYAV